MNIFKVIVIIALISCNGKGSKKVQTEDVYGSFMIALGESPTNRVQCVATFKKNVEEFDHFSLDNTTSIFLDSFRLTFDSIHYPQYDTEIDTNYFHGHHTWQVRNQGKIKKYEFVSKPFKIVSEIPAIVGDADLEVKCNSLQSTDEVTLLVSGDYTDNSETIIDIKPNDGYFIISKSTWQKIEGSNLSIYFNLSSVKNIEPDDLLTSGGKIECTRVSKHYEVKVVH